MLQMKTQTKVEVAHKCDLRVDSNCHGGRSAIYTYTVGTNAPLTAVAASTQLLLAMLLEPP